MLFVNACWPLPLLLPQRITVKERRGRNLSKTNTNIILGLFHSGNVTYTASLLRRIIIWINSLCNSTWYCCIQTCFNVLFCDFDPQAQISCILLAQKSWDNASFRLIFFLLFFFLNPEWQKLIRQLYEGLTFKTFCLSDLYKNCQALILGLFFFSSISSNDGFFYLTATLCLMKLNNGATSRPLSTTVLLSISVLAWYQRSFGVILHGTEEMPNIEPHLFIKPFRALALLL